MFFRIKNLGTESLILYKATVNNFCEINCSFSIMNCTRAMSKNENFLLLVLDLYIYIYIYIYI